MKCRNRVIFGIVGGVVLIATLPFLVILPFAASNAVAAGYYLLFTTRPTQQELVGNYRSSPTWGQAGLVINGNGTFVENIAASGKNAIQINGNWQSEKGSDGLGIEFKPFIWITNEQPGPRYEQASINFYKPRIGSVFAELDPDSGTRFTKQ